MKLLASDLDGTLLRRGETKLHRLTVSAIETVLIDGAVFCVASGRSYSELKRIFADFADRIYFIANDGALAVFNGKTVFEFPIEYEHLCQVDDEKNVVAHGKYISYVKASSDRFVRGIKEQYNGHIAQTDSLCDIKEPIYKLSVYDGQSGDFGLDSVYHKNAVCEYVKKGINKGVALSALLKVLNISAQDTIAIGDSPNDTEMLKLAGKPYVMATALPKVKKIGAQIVNEFKDLADNFKEVK